MSIWRSGRSNRLNQPPERWNEAEPDFEVIVMRTIEEELAAKVKTIAALNQQLAKKDRELASLGRLLDEERERARKAENALLPVKKSLGSMTAERSKWIRKLRRAGVDV